jgi:hypothetical protein
MRLASHPLYGMGSQVTLEGFHIPLGTHSTYFAILFKYGIVGFVFFLLKHIFLWIHTRPPSNFENSEEGIFLALARITFVALLIQAIVTEQNVNGAAYMFIWLFFSTMLTTASFSNNNVIISVKNPFLKKLSQNPIVS